MVASAPPDNDYGAGSSSTTSLEDLARRADQHFQEGLFERAAEEYSQLLAHALKLIRHPIEDGGEQRRPRHETRAQGNKPSAVQQLTLSGAAGGGGFGG